eukprot:g3107.t1
MSLRLIPSKSWNVYSAKNRARVRRDEAADARAKAARASKESLALFETLQARGRERAGLERGTDWTVLSADSAVETGGVGESAKGEKRPASASAGKVSAMGDFSRSGFRKRRRVEPESSGYMRRELLRKEASDPMLKVSAAKAAAKSLLQQHSRPKASDNSEAPPRSSRGAVPFWSFGGTGASAERNSDCEGVGREEKNEKRGRQRSQKATERRKNKLRKRKEKKKREKKRKKKERAQQKRVRKGKG